MEIKPNGVAKISEYQGENNIVEITHDFYLQQASKVSEYLENGNVSCFKKINWRLLDKLFINFKKKNCLESSFYILHYKFHWMLFEI